MKPEKFAEWFLIQGYNVIKTESSFWVEIVPFFYQAIPYNWVIEPDDKELDILFRKTRAIGLRYSTTIAAKEGYISYHVVYDSPIYSLENLPKKARYDVRKGLKSCRIQKISFDRMAREGWKLREETLNRQGRIGAENYKKWEKLCLSAKIIGEIEAWGAIIDDKLVASLIAVDINECSLILYQQSLSNYLQLGVNNALVYTFIEDALKRPDIKSIFYGLHSLDAPESVDEFKFRMNFRPKMVKQRIVFRVGLRPFVNRYILNMLKFLKNNIINLNGLSKFEGICRFYLEGKKPTEFQLWPKPLLKLKG